jgi:hypothetical protein
MSTATFELDSPEGDLYYVEVEITGGHLPATWGWDGGSPAESPEWEIVGITDEDDNEVSRDVLIREMDTTAETLDSYLSILVDGYAAG